MVSPFILETAEEIAFTVEAFMQLNTQQNTAIATDPGTQALDVLAVQATQTTIDMDQSQRYLGNSKLNGNGESRQRMTSMSSA